MGKELYKFGGGIIARKDRHDISRLEDVEGKVVEAVSISGLGACQMYVLSRGDSEQYVLFNHSRTATLHQEDGAITSGGITVASALLARVCV